MSAGLLLPVFLLYYNSLLENGQCTVSMCKVPEEDERILEMIAEHDQSLQAMNQNLSERLRSVSGALQVQDQRLETMNESFSSAIGKINDKLNAILDQVMGSLQSSSYQVDYCRAATVVCDCSEIMQNGYNTSGVYPVYVVDQNRRHCAIAFCDMTTANRRWTIFQRRKDGSVNFYREWNDYVKGFGNPNGEFWLGNEFIHRLTSKRIYRLRIDLEDFDGVRRYAEYSEFNISSSEDRYRLTIGNYSGDAGNSLSYHNGRQFITKDASSSNCAVQRRGAWWYGSCDESNLNGLYLRGNYVSSCSSCSEEGTTWDGFRGARYSLKTTEMKISFY